MIERRDWRKHHVDVVVVVDSVIDVDGMMAKKMAESIALDFDLKWIGFE